MERSWALKPQLSYDDLLDIRKVLLKSRPRKSYVERRLEKCRVLEEKSYEGDVEDASPIPSGQFNNRTYFTVSPLHIIHPRLGSTVCF